MTEKSLQERLLANARALDNRDVLIQELKNKVSALEAENAQLLNDCAVIKRRWQRSAEKVDKAESAFRALHREKERAKADTALLGQTLRKLLNHYLDLANSGDAGFWNPEEEEMVIETRRAIQETGNGE